MLKFLRLLRHADVIFWAACISLAPIELLLPGALVWTPLFAHSEWSRYLQARRPSTSLSRMATLGLLVSVGFILPLKYDDRTVVTPLPGERNSLAAIAEAFPCAMYLPPEAGTMLVDLPSRTPTMREVCAAIEKQTPYSCRIGRCGNGCSILRGAYPIFVTLEAKDKRSDGTMAVGNNR